MSGRASRRADATDSRPRRTGPPRTIEELGPPRPCACSRRHVIIYVFNARAIAHRRTVIRVACNPLIIRRDGFLWTTTRTRVHGRSALGSRFVYVHSVRARSPLSFRVRTLATRRTAVARNTGKRSGVTSRRGSPDSLAARPMSYASYCGQQFTTRPRAA